MTGISWLVIDSISFPSKFSMLCRPLERRKVFKIVFGSFWNGIKDYDVIFILRHLLGALFDKTSEKSFFCEVCQMAKNIRSPYPLSDTISNKKFSLVHSYAWIFSSILTINSYQYLITFIDYYFGSTFDYLLHNRSEVLHIIESFVRMVENQCYTYI